MTHKSHNPGDVAEASGPPGLSVTEDSSTPPRPATGATWPPGQVDGGPWVERWLSPDRLATYLAATAGDRIGALLLYEWNTRVAAALLHDLCHLEIGLRNAYDAALTVASAGRSHWVYVADSMLFPPVLRTRSGTRVDVNAKPRNLVAEAIAAAGGMSAGPGKIIAELGFGFWRYLSSASHEKSLWVPYLHRAFPPGTARRSVDRQVGRLHRVRNRAAHHEPMIRVDLAAFQTDLLGLAGLILPELADHIAATSMLPALIDGQPHKRRLGDRGNGRRPAVALGGVP